MKAEWWDKVASKPALLRGLSAAYAWVAASDGSADESEEKRFAAWLIESPLELPTQARLIDQYRELTSRFGEAPEGALTEVRTLVAAAKDTGEARGLVLVAARSAVVADERIDDREEVVIREICGLIELEDE